MKDIKQKIQNIIVDIEDEIEEKKIDFDGHSEEWQESQYGKVFQAKIDKLQDISDNFNMTINSIETFLQ